MSKEITQWNYLNENYPQTLPALEKILLENRNLNDDKSRAEFFDVKTPFSYSLSSLGLSEIDMQKAIKRLQQAKIAGERVLIFGDYDVDGNSATAIMWQALRDFGIDAQPFIPHRQLHGYGLTDRSLRAILSIEQIENGEADPVKVPNLIITVDNGIVAHEALTKLAQIGVDVILTDHHAPETDPISGSEIFPPAFAIFHSTKLCGAGVAWFFARELLRDPFLYNNIQVKASSSTVPIIADDTSFEEYLKQWLDLACLATLVDQVPVLGANRSLIIFGIEELRKGRRIGIKKLCLSARIETSEITPDTVDYIIGPRINAIGRIKNNLDALRLLCTNSSERATTLASSLEITNQARRDMTDDLLNIAITQADTQAERSMIVVCSSSFHEGIIGLIASRLVEKYSKPVLVIALGESVAKGSARSIPGINVTLILRGVRNHLLEVGGHPMAAGCSIALDQVEIAQAAIFELAAQTITPAQLIPHYEVECQIPASLLDQNFMKIIQKFTPFGTGNEDFLLVCNELELQDTQEIGKTALHRKFHWFDPATNTSLTTIMWQATNRLEELPEIGQKYNLLIKPSINSYRGRQSLQVILEDIHPSEN